MKVRIRRQSQTLLLAQGQMVLKRHVGMAKLGAQRQLRGASSLPYATVISMIDDSDYREGFIQGFRAIRGSAVALPAIPAQPATRAGRTPFQMGIVRGIERGKGWSGGDLRDKE
jgi:hypothetical protein